MSPQYPGWARIIVERLTPIKDLYSVVFTNSRVTEDTNSGEGDYGSTLIRVLHM